MVRDLSPNALGAVYMALGSLAYVVNDGLIRMATEEGLDVFQALFLRGLAMVALFAAVSQARGQRLRRSSMTPPLLTRVAAEVATTALFFTALIRLDFANAQAILMLVPFAVTVIAARQGEPVTRRRYVLVALGFLGVLAVVRPTPDGFSPWSLLVIAAAGALVIREIATQRVEADLPPLPIALLTAVSITSMTGAVSLANGWGPITARSLVFLALACLCLAAGYLFVIETVRVGDLSVSAPFRYTSVVGAVAVGFTFFDEIPDTLTVVGCTLIVFAGVASTRIDPVSA